jgi:hypothetical protein
MWRRVGLVGTDVSEERVTSIFRVEKTRERRKALAVGWLVSQLLTLFFALFLPWKWKRHIPPKSQFLQNHPNESDSTAQP